MNESFNFSILALEKKCFIISNHESKVLVKFRNKKTYQVGGHLYQWRRRMSCYRMYIPNLQPQEQGKRRPVRVSNSQRQK